MKKTLVYWVGLILFALACLAVFQICWMVAIVMYPANRWEFFKGIIPMIFGAIIFAVIGLHMMREGVEDSEG